MMAELTDVITKAGMRWKASPVELLITDDQLADRHHVVTCSSGNRWTYHEKEHAIALDIKSDRY